MKKGVLLFLITGHFAAAQDIALVDREFKKPVSITRQLTGTQLMGKRFPIYTADLDSIIYLMEALSTYINTGMVHKPDMQVLPVGHSHVTVNTQRDGASNTYSIFVVTKSGDLGATMELVKSGAGNRKALQQLLVFLDYLKNNRHIAAEEQ